MLVFINRQFKYVGSSAPLPRKIHCCPKVIKCFPAIVSHHLDFTKPYLENKFVAIKIPFAELAVACTDLKVDVV